MWVISDEQMENIVTSILQQREYRAFRILRREEEFAKMWIDELKEKIHTYASRVADRKIREAVLLEFIRRCVREPKILETLTLDVLINRIENDMK
jgi:hypothetical protein